MRKTKLKIGFIGVGLVALTHIKVLKKIAQEKKLNIEFIGFFDNHYVGKKGFHKEKIFGCSHPSFEKLIKRLPDIIYLCTPPNARIYFETQLIEKGISYFVEKPPLLNYQKKLLASLKRAIITIKVGFQWRFFGFNKILKNIIKNDQIGYIVGYNFNALSFQTWRLNAKISGGAIYERLIHAIDYCCYILDGQVSRLNYYKSIDLLTKNIDKTSTLFDTEILIFKVRQIFCNISTVNFSQTNNVFKLQFVGLKNIYSLDFKKNGGVDLSIINNNKVIKKYSESYCAAYKKENISFLNSYFRKKRDTREYIKQIKTSFIINALFKK